MKWRLVIFWALVGGIGIVWWRWLSPIPSSEEGPAQGFCLRLPISVKGHSVQPLMTYRLTARVVATQPYDESGAGSISPIDLALAWGKTDDPARLAETAFTQGGRFLHWRSTSRGFLPNPEEISNNHIIPATPEIEKVALSLHAGDVIRLRGYLVQVDGAWTSSLTRRDKGDGACELIYVTMLQRLDDPGLPLRSTTVANTHFKRFSTLLTERSGGRRIEAVIVAKQGAKIAFFRQDNQHLYVLALDRLSEDDEAWFRALGDGSGDILGKIEQGLYTHRSDIPDEPGF